MSTESFGVKTNVLYIGGFELPDKNAAAQRVIANSKIIKELKGDVILVGISKDVDQTTFLSEKREFENLSYYNVKYPNNYKSWLHYISTIEHIINLVKKHNITHIIAYNYPGLALCKLKRKCKKNGVKLIADCTEWYDTSVGNPIYRIIKKIDVYLRMKVVQPKLDGLIVISDYLFEYYKKKSKNIINIPPLVDLKMKKWSELDYNKVEDKIDLIYAGSPGHGQKDRLDIIIESILKLIKESKLNIYITIVGLTKEQFLNKFTINKNIEDKIDSFVSFKGRLSHIEVLNYVKKADYQIFVRHENLTTQAGFPTKFVEAISCGTPVLTNSISSISNFHKEGKTGYLLNNSSFETLVSSLKKVFLKDKKEILFMKEYCNTSKMFDISNYKIKMKELIENS